VAAPGLPGPHPERVMRESAHEPTLRGAADDRRTRREVAMWWGIGIGAALLYFVLVFTLGMMTLRNGHGWMFFFGIFFPILWIVGAIMRPQQMAA
jgi:hypothetical protein